MCTCHEPQYGGYCQQCCRHHTLPARQAIPAAKQLFLDLQESNIPDAVALATLFGKARGKMFGVMLAQDSSGARHTIKAFSGQLNGEWLVPGWAPPLFDVDRFHGINIPAEKHIKDLSRQIKRSTSQAEEQRLKIARLELCRSLMKKIHRLYLLHNFHGEQSPMAAFFPTAKGMPTGAGDCCAPKLINYAQRHDLTPLGLAEFYFGRQNRSQTRKHGFFYPSCASSCAKILGFMLCGLEAS